jgi:peroxiredoxin Q/BCP
MFRNRIVVVIPNGIIPLRLPGIGADVRRVWRIDFGHCLSVLALRVRSIASGRSRIVAPRALLYRHRCQSLIKPAIRRCNVTACSAVRNRYCVESFVTIPRGCEICTAAQLPSDRRRMQDGCNNEPPKATKGRRMSAKSRENSSKRSIGKSSAAAAKGAAQASLSVATEKADSNSATRASKRVGKAAKRMTAPKASAPAKAIDKASKKKVTAVASPKLVLEGKKAPNFRLPRDGGKTVSLADYAGQKLVIYFYPRAGTPGCTREAMDFTRLSADFSAAETAVLGVSADPLKAQDAFRDKYKLKTPLLSDESHSMLDSYGAWGEKSMYGKTFEGVLRTTVLIDREGKIVRIWRNVKVDGHADAVLEAARGT